MSVQLTTAQAAFVVGPSLDEFKRAVDKAPVKWRVIVRGRRSERQFRFADLIFLRAYRDLKKELTTEGQAAFYRALHDLPSNRAWHEVEFGRCKYDVHSHWEHIAGKLKDLDQLGRMVDASGGEAFIKGTRIEAHRIAALLDGGMAVDEVLRDYPSLNEKQVLAAKAYAEANPKLGRPYPKLTAKAAMRAGDLSALDDKD